MHNRSAAQSSKLFPLTKRIILLITAFVSSHFVFAQLGGTTTFNSLNLTANARAAALGGNYLAMKDGDLNLCLANPSLLDSNQHGDIALSYVNYFSDVNLGYASFAYVMKPKLTLAATIQYLSYGDFTQTDATGLQTGNFKAGEYIFTVGGGYALDSLFSIGANLRGLYGNIADRYTTGLSLDVAATFNKSSRNFCASLVMKNMGWQISSYTERRDTLPFEIQLGFTKRLKHAPFRFSVVGENLQQWNLTYANPDDVTGIDPITGELIQSKKFEFGDHLMRHIVIGTEFLISKNVHFRIGYNYRRRQELKVANRPGTAGFSYGLGFKINRFQLSYARAIYHLAGPSNTFTITTSVGDW